MKIEAANLHSDLYAVVLVRHDDWRWSPRLGCGIVNWATLDAFNGDRTTSIAPLRLIFDESFMTPAATASEAAVLLGEIQANSQLTLEQVAPLIGVSRRSLQAWRAGDAISARNADRLRRLRDVILALASGTPKATNTSLFARPKNGVSLYDLLREGRLDTALARSSGGQPTREASRQEGLLPQPMSPKVRLSLREDSVGRSTGSVDRQRSRRLNP